MTEHIWDIRNDAINSVDIIEMRQNSMGLFNNVKAKMVWIKKIIIFTMGL